MNVPRCARHSPKGVFSSGRFSSSISRITFSFYLLFLFLEFPKTGAGSVFIFFSSVLLFLFLLLFFLEDFLDLVCQTFY